MSEDDTEEVSLNIRYSYINFFSLSQELDGEYPQIFSNSNKVIMFAFLVTAIGVALPKILSPQLTEKANSGKSVICLGCLFHFWAYLRQH